ncbi:guanylate kinase [Batrachochytrium salamandrivorans]|nr:guanylate kinase [Batrachochytrium salamandrivorans]
MNSQAYLDAHPEIKTVLASFVRELLVSKPDNVVEFAAEHFNALLASSVPPSSKPAPLVIVGPSGVGKGTLIGMLMKEFGAENLGFSVSHTTRKPRPGEEHGVHYNFASYEEIKIQVGNGEFLEHAEVHGNIYGTSFHAVSTVQQSGKICILDIDVQGMQAIKKTDLSPKTLFICPPSHEELEQRLRSRGTEKEEAILKRLATAHDEMHILNAEGAVDFKIVNDDLDSAYANLRQQVLEWYPHLKAE